MSAFDELRFGAERTLNLRESLPSAPEAVRRAENFLREQQIRDGREVLIITGRGSNSPDGEPVLRPAVEKLLFSLRRRGVVASHAEHGPGAFVVQPAPVRQLVEAPPRRRERVRRRPAPPAISGLDNDTNVLLRQLAERSLDALGVRHSASAIEDEMHRHLKALAPGTGARGSTDEHLQLAIRAALAEYD